MALYNQALDARPLLHEASGHNAVLKGRQAERQMQQPRRAHLRYAAQATPDADVMHARHICLDVGQRQRTIGLRQGEAIRKLCS
jgi:hypothetical protein